MRARELSLLSLERDDCGQETTGRKCPEGQEIPPENGGKLFYCEDDWALEQIAQKGSSPPHWRYPRTD